MNQKIEELLESAMMLICVVPGVVISYLLNFIIPSNATEDSVIRSSKIIWFMAILATSFFVSWIGSIVLAIIVALAFYKYGGI